MKTKLLAGLLATALIAPAALAQSSQAPSSNAPAANRPAATNNNAASRNAAASNTVTRNDLWRASKLVGVNVYNAQNEKLGDISEILLDHSGRVAGVVIGVGGFLGMGQHDVMVSMDKLKFVDEPVRTSATTSTNRPSTATTSTAPANTTGSGDTAANRANANRTADANSGHRWYPDHAILDANKDQLKAMPQFKY